MPFISTLVREKRWKDGPSLLVDSGDWSRGHPLCEHFKAYPMVEIMNAMGYDAVGIGDKEFAWPPDTMSGWAEKAAFPFVSSNLYLEGKTAPPFIRRWVEKDFNGLKVGIFGLSMPQKLAEGMRLEEPENAAGEVLRHFREVKTNVVVLLSQLGLPADIALARAFPQISVIVGGHSHHFLPEYLKENETYILQSGSDAQYLGVFTLELGSVVSLASPPEKSSREKSS
jgi:2',3'-cyclic-nucleotide 2'-phosphodiesterase (5'-nucleotidase family)